MRLGFGVVSTPWTAAPCLWGPTSVVLEAAVTQFCWLPCVPALYPASKHCLGWLWLGTRQAWDFTECWAEGGSLHPMQGEGPLLTPAKGKELQLGRTLWESHPGGLRTRVRG